MKTIAISLVCLSLLISQSRAQDNFGFTEPGSFVVGCNYWASHAGLNMWREWKPEIVEADLNQLSEGNIRVIRVFPMWQIKFVRTFVQEMQDHPAIMAWDLGNECNVMEELDNSGAAYLWTAFRQDFSM